MLREADHLDKVKRVKVSEADLEPLKPAYEVGRRAFGCAALLLTMVYGRPRWLI